jgi:hypothetical protein
VSGFSAYCCAFLLGVGIPCCSWILFVRCRDSLCLFPCIDVSGFLAVRGFFLLGVRIPCAYSRALMSADSFVSGFLAYCRAFLLGGRVSLCLFPCIDVSGFLVLIVVH